MPAPVDDDAREGGAHPPTERALGTGEGGGCLAQVHFVEDDGGGLIRQARLGRACRSEPDRGVPRDDGLCHADGLAYEQTELAHGRLRPLFKGKHVIQAGVELEGTARGRYGPVDIRRLRLGNPKVHLLRGGIDDVNAAVTLMQAKGGASPVGQRSHPPETL